MRGGVRSAVQILKPRTWLLCLLVSLLLATAFVVRTPHGDAVQGVDDYPTRLRTAAQNALVDPWLFYNRECTSFVAWRLNNDSGIPFHNYYLDEHWGDASNWAAAARRAGVLVDNVPRQGSVAWWRAGSAGSSRGHVAWVEDASGGSITIEEYNYATRGGYGTRTISSSSSLWPSAFIHIGDSSLRNTDRPTVTGEFRVGERLMAARGIWAPAAAEFEYQWLADGVPIRDATGKAFRPTANQLGKRIQVRVVASKPGLDSASATSVVSSKLKLGQFVTRRDPLVRGTPKVGKALNAGPGLWSAQPKFSYRWYADGNLIRRADDETYTPTPAQLDQTITLRVTATKPGYRSASKVSAPTDAVVPGTFVNDELPSIDGLAQVGTRLKASPGAWTPRGTVSYQWLADGHPLHGVTTRAYTPVADDLRKELAVEVTVRRTGYTTASRTSAVTDAVVPGTFINTRDAAIDGRPQVGVRLTADPGDWSPRATFTYQWLAGGDPIAHATGRGFTPTADEVGKPITLEVTARRPGYLTAVVTSPATADVRPGVIENLGAPTIDGLAIIHGDVTATPGAWSPADVTTTYQWRLDGHLIEGATNPTYSPTKADGGHKLTVKVTVSAPGYRPTSSSSDSVVVLLGQAAFAHKPVIRGRAIVGNELSVNTGNLNPSNGRLSYEWYRGTHLINGADEATYELLRRDIGERIYVRVTLTARNWLPVTRSSTRSDVVQLP